MNVGKVETTTDVMNMRTVDFVGGREDVIRRTRERLSQSPSKGTNILFSAHGNVARAATSVYPDEGEILVFKPQGEGKFLFVGRITPDEWRGLMR